MTRFSGTADLPGTRSLKTTFRNRRNLPGLITVVCEYSIIACALWLALRIDSWWLYPFLVLLIGTRQYAIAEVMTHEAAHRNLCTTRGLNTIMGMICSWPFLQTYEGYRRFHIDHHRVSLADPENNIQEEYEHWRLPEPDENISRAKGLWLFVARPLLGIVGFYHLWAHLSDVYYDRDLKENAVMVIGWIIVLILCWHFGFLYNLLLYWLVPLLYVLATLNYFSEIGDHFRVDGADTRSDLNLWLNRLISHNIGYHALHHADPRIPWYLLPKAYAKYKQHLTEQVSHGYTETFRQILSAPTSPESHQPTLASGTTAA